MKVAIIGAGNVGKALGATFSRAGHDVTYAATSESNARTAAEGVGGSTASSPAAAASAADLVILAVPGSVAEAVAAAIATEVRGKIVVDSTNPLKSDMSGLATEGGPSEAERIAAKLPGARVVKAFNTLFASVQADPGAHGVVVDALYATDDQTARSEVGRLIESFGFRPVYVGPLARARELEAIAFLNISLQLQAQGDWRTAVTLVGAPKAAVEV